MLRTNPETRHWSINTIYAAGITLGKSHREYVSSRIVCICLRVEIRAKHVFTMSERIFFINSDSISPIELAFTGSYKRL